MTLSAFNKWLNLFVGARPTAPSKRPKNILPQVKKPSVATSGNPIQRALCPQQIYRHMQSYDPKLDQLRRLVHADDVIGINGTWLNLQSRNMVAKIMSPDNKMFSGKNYLLVRDGVRSCSTSRRLCTQFLERCMSPFMAKFSTQKLKWLMRH